MGQNRMPRRNYRMRYGTESQARRLARTEVSGQWMQGEMSLISTHDRGRKARTAGRICGRQSLELWKRAWWSMSATACGQVRVVERSGVEKRRATHRGPGDRAATWQLRCGGWSRICISQ